MKISYNWLQKYFKDKLPEPNIIADGIIFHSFEIEEIEKVGDDTIFEIKILPDRAHDCLSHWGIAKEVSVIFDIPINDIDKKVVNIESKSDLQIEVDSINCRRYIGRVVKGVKVGQSPKWLSDALVSIGQKSINNIVDATNYVMYDLGNPIHAFDLDKLKSHKIIIKEAKDGERFILLDKREVILDSSIMTICDEADVLAIAGVKGGKKAEIDEFTKNIVIEVANFNPIAVRKAAKKLGIFTDSAKRFENDISPTIASMVMDHITNLIVEISGGEVYEYIDIYKKEDDKKIVSFNINYLRNMLGVDIEEKLVDNILDRFNYDYKKEGNNYELKISPLRLDINGAHDLVEEIGRIYGYDKIVPILPKIDFNIKENIIWMNINQAKNYLIKEGYREVMNYVFTDKGEVEVMEGASDKNFLRTNLSDGIKKSLDLNRLNISLLGDNEIKVFEIGTIFLKDREEIRVAYGDKKGIVEMHLDKFVDEKISSGEHGYFSTEKFLVLGSTASQVSPEETSHLLTFKPWSLFPFITRDISVWVPEGIESDLLFKIYKELGTDLLVKDPELVDKFQKGDKISYAYRLVFQAYDRTLTDEEINKIMVQINEKIISLGWQVR